MNKSYFNLHIQLLKQLKLLEIFFENAEISTEKLT